MSIEPKTSAEGSLGKPDQFETRFSGRNLLPIAALVVVNLALYYNSLSNGFVFDDYAVIVENKHIKDLGNSLPAFLNSSYFTIAGGESSYRPIATLSYFLIHSLAGPNPFYYHLSSVLLHTLNVLLVFVLFCLLLGDPFKALPGGLLFASHPVLTEAVDCIAFNEDLLAAFFFFAPSSCMLKEQEKGPGAQPIIYHCFFFFAGFYPRRWRLPCRR